MCGLVPEWGTAVDVEVAANAIGDIDAELSVLCVEQRERPTALTALRQRIQRGLVTEYPVDRRQEFARWLVQNGRLAG